MVFERTQHSVYELEYQLLLPFVMSIYLNDPDLLFFNNHFERIGLRFGISLLSYRLKSNYIVFKFKTKPDANLLKFINSYKSTTSRLFNKSDYGLTTKLWLNHYVLSSNCDRDIEDYYERKV